MWHHWHGMLYSRVWNTKYSEQKISFYLYTVRPSIVTIYCHANHWQSPMLIKDSNIKIQSNMLLNITTDCWLSLGWIQIVKVLRWSRRQGPGQSIVRNTGMHVLELRHGLREEVLRNASVWHRGWIIDQHWKIAIWCNVDRQPREVNVVVYGVVHITAHGQTLQKLHESVGTWYSIRGSREVWQQCWCIWPTGTRRNLRNLYSSRNRSRTVVGKYWAWLEVDSRSVDSS